MLNPNPHCFMAIAKAAAIGGKDPVLPHPLHAQPCWGRVHRVLSLEPSRFEHYLTLRPVIEAIGMRPCIMVSPLPIFITDSCCHDEQHMINRRDRDYRATLERQLDGVDNQVQKPVLQRREAVHPRAGHRPQLERERRCRCVGCRPYPPDRVSVPESGGQHIPDCGHPEGTEQQSGEQEKEGGKSRRHPPPKQEAER
jgi:hypothetical protein